MDANEKIGNSHHETDTILRNLKKPVNEYSLFTCDFDMWRFIWIERSLIVKP